MSKKTKLWLRRGYMIFTLAAFIGLLKLGHPGAALLTLFGLAALGLPITYFLKWR